MGAEKSSKAGLAAGETKEKEVLAADLVLTGELMWGPGSLGHKLT